MIFHRLAEENEEKKNEWKDWSEKEGITCSLVGRAGEGWV